MRRVNIICVGKLKKDYLKQGVADYAKRLSKYCTLNIIELNDYADSSYCVEKESELILKSLQGLAGYNILLDINGKIIDSVELGDIVDKAYLYKGDTVNFIIGGSNGVSAAVKQRADFLLSFGKMTMAHGIIRLVLLEQVYRGFNILANTPYHK